MATSLYNLRTAGAAFTITKFDEDFNVLSSYTITPKGFDFTCNCPANNRSVIVKPCRHRRMMRVLLPVVDTGQFYNPDTDQFCEMLGDPHREPPSEKSLADIPMGELSALEAAVMKTLHEASSIPEPAEDVGEAHRQEPLVGEAVPLPILQYNAENDSVKAISGPELVRAAQAPTIRRR